jgi:hypothetical protein
MVVSFPTRQDPNQDSNPGGLPKVDAAAASNRCFVNGKEQLCCRLFTPGERGKGGNNVKTTYFGESGTMCILAWELQMLGEITNLHHCNMRKQGT